jgi:hypothetical protein
MLANARLLLSENLKELGMDAVRIVDDSSDQIFGDWNFPLPGCLTVQPPGEPPPDKEKPAHHAQISLLTSIVPFFAESLGGRKMVFTLGPPALWSLARSRVM